MRKAFTYSNALNNFPINSPQNPENKLLCEAFVQWNDIKYTEISLK